MTKIKYLLPAIAVLLAGGFFWLQAHDQKVKWQALAEQRAKDIDQRDSVTASLWKAIKAMDSAYAKDVKKHKQALGKMQDSVKTLDNEVDRLAHEITKELPEPIRIKVDSLVAACNVKYSLVLKNLTNCEDLRHRAELASARKDTVIRNTAKSRDDYKKLWQEANEPRPDAWSTIGKLTTVGGLLTIITKLVGLW